MRARVESEADLLERVEADVAGTDRERVLFHAGHFPLTYDEVDAADRTYEAKADVRKWAPFSEYTLRLATRLAAVSATEHGKEVGFVFVADDYSYASTGGQRNARRRFYRRRSGADATLDPAFRQILQHEVDDVAFDESHVVRHDHGKPGREACLYFSENVLRDPANADGLSSDEVATVEAAESACGREYSTLLLGSAVDHESDHFVSFIPDSCHADVCDAVLDRPTVSDSLSASHVFVTTKLEQMQLSSVDDLYRGTLASGDVDADFGVRYRRD